MHPGHAHARLVIKEQLQSYIAVLKFMTYMCLKVFGSRPERAQLERATFESNDSRAGLSAWSPSMHVVFYNDVSNRWQCQVCLRSSASRLTGDCPGQLAAGSRHKVWSLQQYMFCVTCGAHTSKRVVYLTGPCPGSPPTSSMVTCLARLKAGKHPVSSIQLGFPRPIECLPLPDAEDPICLGSLSAPSTPPTSAGAPSRLARRSGPRNVSQDSRTVCLTSKISSTKTTAVAEVLAAFHSHYKKNQ